jgi:hypothetical protein
MFQEKSKGTPCDLTKQGATAIGSLFEVLYLEKFVFKNNKRLKFWIYPQTCTFHRKNMRISTPK